MSSNNLISLSDRATDGLLMHFPFNFDICQASTIPLVVLSWWWNYFVARSNNGSHFFVVHCALCAARCVYGRPLRLDMCSLRLTFTHLLVCPTYWSPHVNGILYTTFFLHSKNLSVLLIVHLVVLLLALSSYSLNCRAHASYFVFGRKKPHSRCTWQRLF